MLDQLINGYYNFVNFLNSFGNSYGDAVVAFLVALIVLKLFHGYVIMLLHRIAKKTKSDLDDLVIDGIKGLNWNFYLLLSLYIGSRFLTIPTVVDVVLNLLIVVFLVYYGIKIVQRIVDHVAAYQIKKAKKDQENPDTSLISILSTLIKGSLWVIGGLLVLQNLGVEIGPLLAGLGIGGIAIAFALQGVLEDLFAAFSIYFDKPFQKGDYIVIGTDKGTVEKVGLKSTRVRTLQGEELVISNKELTSTRVNNYKKMEKRRIAFRIGVEYGTPVKKLEKIPKIVHDIIEKVEKTDPDRVHFNEFGDFALLFDIVYYINSKEYIDYMNAQQEINLEIAKSFEKEKISMAFPTQTIHLKK